MGGGPAGAFCFVQVDAVNLLGGATHGFELRE